MFKCPCCGKDKPTYVNSRVRYGVYVCHDCQITGNESNRNWRVDAKEAPNNLRLYFKAYNDFVVADNCCDDRNKVQKLRLQYEQMKLNRRVQFVIAVEDSDGFDPIAEFDDTNHALARVMGWLGHGFTPYGNNCWVSAHGSVIQIMHL